MSEVRAMYGASRISCAEIHLDLHAALVGGIRQRRSIGIAQSRIEQVLMNRVFGGAVDVEGTAPNAVRESESPSLSGRMLLGWREGVRSGSAGGGGGAG